MYWQSTLRTPLFFVIFSGVVFLQVGQTGCPSTEEDGDGDGWTAPSDCDDTDPAVFPGASEVCNGIDDDCNGAIDDHVASHWYPDEDGDGFGADTGGLETCSPPSGYVAVGLDCDDEDSSRFPGAIELCDGVDHDCDGKVGDVDVPAYYPDQDRDGFGDSDKGDCTAKTGYVQARGDCNDGDASVHPGAVDTDGDGVDQDCGGTDAAEPHVGLSALSRATIQDALGAAVEGSTIWVGPGTYLEHGLSFGGKRLQLMSTELAPRTIVDASGQGPVLQLEDVPYYTLVDGLTLRGGAPDPGGEEGAAGIIVRNGDPTLRYCVIRENAGSGVFISGANPVLVGCTVVGNLSHGIDLRQASATIVGADLSGNGGDGFRGEDAGLDITESRMNGNGDAGLKLTRAGAWIQDDEISGNGLGIDMVQTGATVADSRVVGNTGQGLYLGESSPDVLRCEISSNGAEGVVADDAAHPRLLGCTLSDNLGSGVAVYYDAGYTEQAHPWLEDCLISGNQASAGAGLYAGYQTGATLENCTLWANQAGGDGGGIYAYGGALELHNVLIFENSAARGGGLYLEGTSAELYNTVVAANDATQAGGMLVVDDGGNTKILNAILAYNDAGNLLTDGAVPVLEGSDLYNPSGVLNHDLGALENANTSVEPGFLTYDADGRPTDPHLALDSSLVDFGVATSEGETDADGSPCDPGIYGGALGASWDRDGDGYADYFWPGTFVDVPTGVFSGSFDQDDLDPTVH